MANNIKSAHTLRARSVKTMERNVLVTCFGADSHRVKVCDEETADLLP